MTSMSLTQLQSASSPLTKQKLNNKNKLAVVLQPGSFDYNIDSKGFKKKKKKKKNEIEAKRSRCSQRLQAVRRQQYVETKQSHRVMLGHGSLLSDKVLSFSGICDAS